MEKYHFTVSPECADQRVDCFLSEQLPELSRSRIQQLLEAQQVLANGNPAKKNLRLRPEMSLEVFLPESVPDTAVSQEIPLAVVYEDDDLLVVNKEKGMVVHPAAGHPDGTLVNALLHHCGSSLSGIGGVLRPGIVHRIDKDTSGLLIVAKNDWTHQRLSTLIHDHDFLRVYACITYGHFSEPEFTVHLPIARSRTDRKKMAVCAEGEGRDAITNVRVLETLPGFTYAACRLETGRTHQIRVHLAAIGHPLAGDPLYGPKKCLTECKGQMLHAKKLGFVHPRTGVYHEFEAPLPPDFTAFLDKLRRREKPNRTD